MAEYRHRPKLDITLLLFVVAAILAGGLLKTSYSQESLKAILALPQKSQEMLLEAFAVTVAVVAILVRIFHRYVFRRRDAGGLLIVVTILFLALPIYLFNANRPPEAVTSLAAIMATIGWIGQRNQTARNARKQHTLNVLFHFRLSEIFNNHRINVMSRWPEGSVMKPEEADALLEARGKPSEWEFTAGQARFPIVESVQHILGFYEYLCAGVEVGDIDEPFLRETIWPIMAEFYVRMRAYIEHEQNLGITCKQRAFRGPVWKPTRLKYIHYYNVFVKRDSYRIKRTAPPHSGWWQKIKAKLARTDKREADISDKVGK
ncbi:MAG TPA: hypothetical protein VL689_18380 [Paraburkholderia sp.]|nr:hypothetical protein [Paraburkholderia sp.]